MPSLRPRGSASGRCRCAPPISHDDQTPGLTVPELDDRESLRDLDGIYVEIGPLPSSATKQGLSAERLKEDVEGQLRRAGVTVLAMGDFRTGDPHLQIVAGISDAQGRMVALRVE